MGLHIFTNNRSKYLYLILIGSKCIPWLGDLNQLGAPSDAGSTSTFTTFPVKPSEKRSYAQACVVWVQPGGLQADIQKILRHARKMPDKTQHFYKVNILIIHLIFCLFKKKCFDF